MTKLSKTLIILAFFTLDLSGQSNSGFVASLNYSFGNLIGGEKLPRVEHEIYTGKLQFDYALVNWDHTILRLGLGYHLLFCRDSRVGYMQFPIVFQRFIRSNKSGFNTSLVLLPSYSLGEDLELCNNNKFVDFNIELAIRVGTTLDHNNHRFGIEIEATAPMSSMQKFGTLKYIIYGVKIGYYL